MVIGTKRSRKFFEVYSVYTAHCAQSVSNRRMGELRASTSNASGSWTVEELRLLCDEGELDKALDVLLGMEQRGIFPSVDLYATLLKACTKRKALAQAKRVHAHMVENGLGSLKFLGELVLITLTRCGGIEDAVQVLDSLPNRTVFAWTAVISGYTSAGQGQNALKMYHRMRLEGLKPDTYTLVTVLKACGSVCDLEEGKRVHAEALTYGFETNIFVGTCLVDMYLKCGCILDAQEVFRRLSVRDVVSWTAMLSGFVQKGQPGNALQLYGQMLEEGVNPNNRTLVCALQACGMLAEEEEADAVGGLALKVQNFCFGKVLHFEAERSRCSSDVFIGSALVSMYGKCGSLIDARHVFENLPEKNAVSWNAMLAACALHGQAEQALELYEEMLQEAVDPDDRTFVSVIQAWSILAEKESSMYFDAHAIRFRALQEVKVIHAEAWSRGYETDVYVGSALVSTYAKCASLVDARDVFDGLSERNVVTWNAMLAGYSQQDQAQSALQLYEQMVEEAVSPNDRTFVSTLQACGLLAEAEGDAYLSEELCKVNSLCKSKALHVEACRRGCASDVFVNSTLVSVYGKCGSIADAQNVCELSLVRDVVVWNAMLATFVQHGQGEKALQMYDRMQEAEVSPNEITFLCTLQACSSTGSLAVCKDIHSHVITTGSNFSPLLWNTIIHAYGRCADMLDAQKVFDALPERNVTSWNALLAGYAREGNFAATLRWYEEMCREDVRPDGVTFVILLSACSHAGLVHAGIGYFESMSTSHSITPEIEHYVSMVDLLARAGYLDRVRDLLSAMPMKPNLSMCLCLLSACRKHGKVVLGKEVFAYAVQLQPKNAAPYVLMSNIYANAGLLDAAGMVNALRKQAGASKVPGATWIRFELDIYTFVVGGLKYQRQALQDVLWRLSAELCQAVHPILRAPLTG